MGARRGAYELAEELRNGGCKVVVVDDDERRLAPFSEGPLDVGSYKVDPLDYSRLKEIGITEADAVIAMHPSDAVNVTVSVYAKRHNVPKIVAVLSDDKVGEALVETEITKAVLTSGRQIARGVLEALFDVKIVEVGDSYLVVLDSSERESLVGASVRELEEKLGRVIAILDKEGERSERERVARGDVILALVPRAELIKALRSIS